MERLLKNQQIPLVQVIDPISGQQYYAPESAIYTNSTDTNPIILKNVTVDQAVSASYFSGSITNAVSSSYATTASYLDRPVTSASYAITASYANYAETASSALNAQDILIRVLNQSGNSIAKGIVVHITASGNSSDIPRIITASYENDANSANTLGITNQSIANGAEGFVMTEGVLKGINTQAFQSGQLIYLGATGSIIGYAPTAPLHSVRLGQVVREQSNNGSIYVRIDNGYELGELHDVRDTTTTSSYGDLLIKSGSVWTNSKQLTGSYSITGSLTISGSSTFTNIGPAIFSGSVASTNGFTGSFQGTSSYSIYSANSDRSVTSSFSANATSASYALVASSIPSYETAWTSYTPTWSTDSTQPTLGNGSITGAYKVIGKTCFVRVRLYWGTTTNSGTGAFYFSLPVTASSSWGIQFPCSILDNGNAWYQATVNGEYGGFTTKTALIGQSAGGANSSQGITGVFPFTFGDRDSIQFNGSYEIA